MSNNSLLVVVAHGDDEVLGAGGVMAKRAAAGDRVSVVILADGVGSRNTSTFEAERARRRDAARAACEILGAQPPLFHEFPDNRMDTVALLDIAQVIEQHIADMTPSWIITHHDSDVNIDHKRTHLACQAACRPQSGHPVRRLMYCEVASSTEWRTQGAETLFQPNWFEDISQFMRQKQAALAAYAEEMREWPHPRSYQGVEALNTWRGAMVGVDRAEAFQLGRQIG
ncbi:PIG-L deacetylase family protein [Pontivivens insulae]|uniref:N-acetyl-alpha-D-glucosaminyl L-malate deacetylase 1 n=1 Tax=Pontivivens insulae TaxID=1639689 RepID=A0A2R8A828_9RHOB|nr:PIG-L deacetylase family protein [Pontivivens insulae]RED18290.1 LmbE family N-acetylglucosaminyl deacetylase [Pontivivens insulae]SPF28188.1 N-acetyl-alpha-D-glucosaminyl L-malate deacetylase 1 [Pontivivens insulae]